MYKILLIEDDLEAAKSIEMFLEINDFEVIHCKTGQEAIEAIETTPFDLIINDRYLPDMDGLELFKQLKETLGIPIIVVSAMSEVENQIKEYNFDRVNFMQKPVKPLDLLTEIENYLEI